MKNINTHGMSNTSFYHCWGAIKVRCYNKKDKFYKHYGGRGIKCLWKSFEEFKNDMYESYKIHLNEFGEGQTLIDRIDNNGNYCKENCRWVTQKQSANNRRSNISLITFRNKTKSLADWAEELNINYGTLRDRIMKYNWSIEEALTIKVSTLNKYKHYRENMEREKKCSKCEYRWTAKTENPKSCPRCKTRLDTLSAK